jgi:hypothetical protein
MVEANRQPEPNVRRPGWLARLLGGMAAAVAVFRGLAGAPARVGAAPLAPPAGPEEGDGQPPGGLQNASVRYEHSDAKFRWILGLIVGAMIFAVVVFFVILRFFDSYAAYEAKVKASQYPLATDNGRLPPSPRLEQLNRMADIERGNVYLREEAKEEALHSYGALEEEGYVRVPIERAMDFLAQGDRLPARPVPPGDVKRRQNGLVDGGASNSGRLLREKSPWDEP